jgi:pimeloyl-ACP methyl ester carboxylesterase
MKFRVICSLFVVSLALAACGEARLPKLSSEQVCHTGAYRLADGRVIDIAPSEGADLRWRLEDGQTGLLKAAANWRSMRGWTDKPGGKTVSFGGCDEGLLTFAAGDGEPVSGHKIRFVERETTFRDGDVELYGRLVLPEGDGPVPVVIEVHESERDAATVYNYRQRLLPAQGVGVFVYDKRGTGHSTGRYTQDFDLLARDAAAAVKAARNLAGDRGGRIGLEGGSQGGWVAPLAATLVPVDFVIVGYGMADSPLSENRDEALQDLEAAGFTDAATRAKALEVIAATEAVVTSHFESGYAGLDAVRKKYGKEPWFKAVKGEFTGELLKYPNIALRIVGPMRDVGTTWNYDSVATLRRLNVPLLWVLAADDTSAPPTITRERLLKLAAEGRPITVMQFPHTEHGIIEYETGEKGERIETRYAEGYFRTTLDFARDGRLSPPYGAGVILTANDAPPTAPTPVLPEPPPVVISPIPHLDPPTAAPPPAEQTSDQGTAPTPSQVEAG